jgi:hypothetical protein
MSDDSKAVSDTYIFLLCSADGAIQFTYFDFATAVLKAQSSGLVLKRLRIRADGSTTTMTIMNWPATS